MAADTGLSATFADAFSEALLDNALPGELEGFTGAEQADAAAFIAEAAETRRPGEIALKLQSVGGEAARRLMRLVIINDDMPFLVDSVAAVIAGHGLTVRRLLHPIVHATRDGDRLVRLGEGQAESIIYVELDRADARGRHELVLEIENVLANVRAAVRDWKAMVATMAEDAAAVAGTDTESAALLSWLADNNFTLLGHKVVGADGDLQQGLGILSGEGIDLWTVDDLRGLLDALRQDPRRGADAQGRSPVAGAPPRAARRGGGSPSRWHAVDSRRPVDQRRAAHAAGRDPSGPRAAGGA